MKGPPRSSPYRRIVHVYWPTVRWDRVDFGPLSLPMSTTRRGVVSTGLPTAFSQECDYLFPRVQWTGSSTTTIHRPDTTPGDRYVRNIKWFNILLGKSVVTLEVKILIFNSQGVVLSYQRQIRGDEVCSNLLMQVKPHDIMVSLWLFECT